MIIHSDAKMGMYGSQCLGAGACRLLAVSDPEHGSGPLETRHEHDIHLLSPDIRHFFIHWREYLFKGAPSSARGLDCDCDEPCESIWDVDLSPADTAAERALRVYSCEAASMKKGLTVLSSMEPTRKPVMSTYKNSCSPANKTKLLRISFDLLVHR